MDCVESFSPLADKATIATHKHYALGWRVSKAMQEIPFSYIHHGGVSKGSMAWLAVIPKQHMAVALAINTQILPFSRWSAVFSNLAEIFQDTRPPGHAWSQADFGCREKT